MRVLILDQSRIRRKVLRHALGALGIEQIIEAVDEPDALSRGVASPPDLILIDLESPPDPLPALRHLRARIPSPPILALAPALTRTRLLAAAREGASRCLLRPFTPDELTEAIRACALPLPPTRSSRSVWTPPARQRTIPGPCPRPP